MKATLLGTGAYGLAIASKLASNNINVCMWTENKEKEKAQSELKRAQKTLKYILKEINQKKAQLLLYQLQQSNLKMKLIKILI